jgi:hypothetical protein
MAKKIVINLSTDERFRLFGYRISRVTLEGKWALLYSWQGFVASVSPDNEPAVHNVIEARKDHIRFDEKLSEYVLASQADKARPAKNVRIPAITRLVRQLMEAEGHQRANMPGNGGWAVSPSAWDMKTVAMIHWAYAGTEPDGTPSNMVAGRPQSPEIRKIGEMLQEHGYKLWGFREDLNHFFVVPDGV